MPRGSKKGENRFKASQEAKIDFRLKRIKDTVVPQLKAISHHVDISSINRYAKLVCEIFNTDLPISEKKLSVRTVTHNAAYWKVLGRVYYQFFETKTDLESFKNSILQSEKNYKLNELIEEKERLTAENTALKSALTSVPMAQVDENIYVETSDSSINENYLCKIIDKLISAADGVIQVDLDKGEIHNLAEDLGDENGILPVEVVAPYIEYLQTNKKPD